MAVRRRGYTGRHKRVRGYSATTSRTARHHGTSAGRRGWSVTRLADGSLPLRWLRADMSPVRMIAPRGKRRRSGFARTIARLGVG